MSASRVAGSGRGMPDGGIMPARSFRTIFSPISGVVAEVREIELVEQQVGRLQLLVVADHTVLIDERALRGDVRRGGDDWRVPRRGLPGWRARRLARDKGDRNEGQAPCN